LDVSHAGCGELVNAGRQPGILDADRRQYDDLDGTMTSKADLNRRLCAEAAKARPNVPAWDKDDARQFCREVLRAFPGTKITLRDIQD
jgi:hypothetical protein